MAYFIFRFNFKVEKSVSHGPKPRINYFPKKAHDSSLRLDSVRLSQGKEKDISNQKYVHACSQGPPSAAPRKAQSRRDAEFPALCSGDWGLQCPVCTASTCLCQGQGKAGRQGPEFQSVCVTTCNEPLSNAPSLSETQLTHWASEI